MQGNGYTIIYTALIMTAILQIFVRLGIGFMLLTKVNVNDREIDELLYLANQIIYNCCNHIFY